MGNSIKQSGGGMPSGRKDLYNFAVSICHQNFKFYKNEKTIQTFTCDPFCRIIVYDFMY
jgi:hypothetical protein